MDKVKWLQQLAEQNPQDAQTHYWLGKELAEAGRWLEAVQSFSAGVAHCTDEVLRAEIIRELTKATVQLQQDKPSHSVLPPMQESRPSFEEAEPKIKWMDRSAKLKVIDGGREQKSEEPTLSQVTFADVAGLDELKKTIHLRIISPFFNKGLFAKFRKKAGGGVLLYGPPGCGKTFIARATAGECQAHFYPVHITDILDPYIGVSEQNLKAIFDKARFQKPSIMFFDEVDTIGFSRAKSSANTRGVIDTFLAEMEGLDTNTDQMLVIGATNMPWDVDNALKRPGRFDRLIFVAPPDEKAREQIFQLKLEGRYAETIDVAKLAAQTEFFSGADIENVCELAAEHVLEEILTTGQERPLRTEDLLHVLKTQQPSTLEWLRTAKNYVKYANQSGLYNDVEQYLRKYGRKI
ncbi:ATP-binding protein [Bacillus sp. REN10]|uniref:ATP-binding protein n=1 Tax=Bacillus sp. REN10 TaxID=2782541 RepID=UPI00193B8544|nr:ATP-binding protein [Bacillus sp. REN10]